MLSQLMDLRSCHAGQIGLRKGPRSVIAFCAAMGCQIMRSRSFECLAATQEMDSTRPPGEDSFTSALLYALETLVEERKDGRFTTVELLNKIKLAPHFPKDQTPILINREKKFSAGRIMLHPLPKEGLHDDLSPKETAGYDPRKKHALTLHFDFSEKPSQIYIETLGRELNEIFQRNVGVNRVRWGGIRRHMFILAAKSFLRASRERRRRLLPQLDPSIHFPHATLGENPPVPLTPSSSNQHSPRTTEPGGKGSPASNAADISAISLPRPMVSSSESESHAQEHQGRRKRRKLD